RGIAPARAAAPDRSCPAVSPKIRNPPPRLESLARWLRRKPSGRCAAETHGVRDQMLKGLRRADKIVAVLEILQRGARSTSQRPETTPIGSWCSGPDSRCDPKLLINRAVYLRKKITSRIPTHTRVSCQEALCAEFSALSPLKAAVRSDRYTHIAVWQ